MRDCNFILQLYPDNPVLFPSKFSFYLKLLFLLIGFVVQVIHSFDGSGGYEESNPEASFHRAPIERAVAINFAHYKNGGAKAFSAASHVAVENLDDRVSGDKKETSSWNQAALQHVETANSSDIPISATAAVVTTAIGQLGSPKVTQPKTRGLLRVEEPVTEEVPALVEKYSALCGEVVGGRGGGAGTIVNKLLKDARNQVGNFSLLSCSLRKGEFILSSQFGILNCTIEVCKLHHRETVREMCREV